MELRLHGLHALLRLGGARCELRHRSRRPPLLLRPHRLSRLRRRLQPRRTRALAPHQRVERVGGSGAAARRRVRDLCEGRGQLRHVGPEDLAVVRAGEGRLVVRQRLAKLLDVPASPLEATVGVLGGEEDAAAGEQRRIEPTGQRRGHLP